MTAGSEAEAVRALQALGETLRHTAPGLRQSILQDVERGRRLEAHEALGHTLHLAVAHRVAAPTFDLCCRMLRTLDRVAGAHEDLTGKPTS